jgi:BirA family biotin operon repressor/biotin-[acetyl-CoA-carboxylase] ligase
MHLPLTEIDLFPCGPLGRLGQRVATLSQVDSTNAFLLARAAEWPDGSVATAEFQSAGRGRQGRRWLAPRGSSILLSVLLIEPEDSPRITHAALLAALACAEAVEAETNCRPELRWPNDVVIAGKKLAGVLAESTPLARVVGPGLVGGSRPGVSDEAQRALVIGVGLNCFQQPGHLGPELANIATSLEIECAQPVDRPALARRLIERLDACFTAGAWQDRHWTRLSEAWTARGEDLGAHVILEENSRRFAGTVLEIADNGDLIVQLDSGGRRRFESTTTTRFR